MSPTIQTLLIGFISLAVLAGSGYLLGKSQGLRYALYGFWGLWLAYCIWHLTVGLSHGYSLATELGFLVLNYALPAVLALGLFKKWG
ncbi:MAG: hypothetical protein E6Q83_09605 [Thiothrix sp.]|nr:MAG: hypothetical protein E6Q83_09605 [Thiothrix sp.]